MVNSTFFNSNVLNMLSLVVVLFIKYCVKSSKVFQVFCRNCDRSFENVGEPFKKKEKQLSAGRTLMQEKYVRTKTKQMSKLLERVKTKITLQLNNVEIIFQT